MPDDDDIDKDNNELMREFAATTLSNMFPDNEVGREQYEELRKNTVDLAKRLFRWEDNRPKKTNKLLHKAMNIKTPVVSLLCSMRNAAEKFYK